MAQGIEPNLPKKFCSECGIFFIPNTKHQKYCSIICKDKNLYWRGREKRLLWNKLWYQKKKQLRLEVLGRYGGLCECCSEAHPEFLAIDHISGGGNKHRKILKGQYVSIYRFLKTNNYPLGFRVLCHNCNSSIGYYGYCPHKKI